MHKHTQNKKRSAKVGDNDFMQNKNKESLESSWVEKTVSIKMVDGQGTTGSLMILDVPRFS